MRSDNVLDFQSLTENVGRFDLRDTTLLLPEMARIGSHVLAAAFRGFGINAKVMDTCKGLDLGKEYTSGKECYPCQITTGDILYFLKKEDIMKMDRMGDKLAENILKAIDKGRDPGLTNLIYALGIRNVGYHLAGVVAKSFKSIDNLARQTIEDLSRIYEIGPIVAQSIYNFFHNPKNLKVLEKLKKGGVKFPAEKIEEREAPLSGKTFVLTGGLDSFTRTEARKLIEDKGGRVASSVSNKTDFVIAGKDPGSKYDNALRLGIRILDEAEFKTMIE